MYFLLGLMGSGKSWWGERLAKRFNLPFVDLDKQIESAEGISIPEIFMRLGETGFRQLEREYLHRLAAIPEAVVATGGGTPCFFDNLEWMNAHGITLYLKTPVSLLVTRLVANRADRPLLADTPGYQLQNRLEYLLQHREPFYREALITIKQTGDQDILPFLEEKIRAFQSRDEN